MPDTILTMVADEDAEVGKAFIFMGEQIECTECKFCKICLNLEKGRRYEIISVRPLTHECLLTDEQSRVVEVIKTDRTVCVDKKYAIDGSLITFFHSECKQIGCEHYHQCNPDGIPPEEKVKVGVVKGEAHCLLRRAKNVVTIQ